jgi:2,5-diketo-D-gluconate reductase A
MPTSPTVTFNNGVAIPQLGFGVYQVPDAETQATVEIALEAGYRHIDTAQLYRNEAGVGAAIKASGIARDEVFVTTKVWNSEQGFDKAIASFERSMERLDMDKLDLLLIHWPAPALDRYLDTWRAFESLYADERVRAIGVSNFGIDHLQRLIGESTVVPAINQIELHPMLAQDALRAFHAEHGIVSECWAPLARGQLQADPTIVSIAHRTGKSPAQVILRWQMELGNVAIPKSVTASRIAENIDIFDFSLEAADLAAMATIDKGTRLGPDPDEMSMDFPFE